MKRHNCLTIFYFLIRGAFLIIFGVCTTILGALVAIIGASDLILGPLSKVRGTFHIKPSVQSIKLTANPFILGAFAIIFGAQINFSGAAFFIFGGWFPMLGAFSVVSCHMICGQFSNGFGANILLLGANNLLLGARRFCSFSVIFGALATWYSQNQYIWSSKLLQNTCSHEICEAGTQSPPFRLFMSCGQRAALGREWRYLRSANMTYTPITKRRPLQ